MKKNRNIADPDQVKEQGIKQKDLDKIKGDDVRTVLGTRQGRRFFYRYLQFSKVFSTCFTGNSETFFNEGMRNVGLSILNDINSFAPEKYELMMREAREDKSKEDQ